MAKKKTSTKKTSKKTSKKTTKETKVKVEEKVETKEEIINGRTKIDIALSEFIMHPNQNLPKEKA